MVDNSLYISQLLLVSFAFFVSIKFMILSILLLLELKIIQYIVFMHVWQCCKTYSNINVVNSSNKPFIIFIKSVGRIFSNPCFSFLHLSRSVWVLHVSERVSRFYVQERYYTENFVQFMFEAINNPINRDAQQDQRGRGESCKPARNTEDQSEEKNNLYLLTRVTARVISHGHLANFSLLSSLTS